MPWFFVVLQLITLVVLYNIVKKAGMPQLALAIVVSDMLFLLGVVFSIPVVAPIGLIVHLGLLTLAFHLMRKYKTGPWKEL